MRRILAAAGLVVAGVLLGVLVAWPRPIAPHLGGTARPLLGVGAAWLVYAAAAWLARKAPPRIAVALIVLGGVALPLATALQPPTTSDDVYRYVWDGRVQAAGINPYRYAPAAPQLVDLRDPYLWPAESVWCVQAGDRGTDGAPLTPGCSRINRPRVHTIYPPVAQSYFRAVEALSPAGPSTGSAVTRPFQLAGAAIAVAITVLLLLTARLRRADPRTAVLWAWCPAVLIEAAGNAHVDVVAAFITALVLLWLARGGGRTAAAGGGALLAIAIATKLTPALVVPAVARRRPLMLAAGAAGALVLIYLPHILAVGMGALGFVPGYLAEEGYANGSRFALLTLLVPHAWATPIAAVILAAVAVLVARTSDPDRPWLGAATMTGIALFITTPAYPWYGLLMVLLVAMGARSDWLIVVAAAYLAQFPANLHLSASTAQRIGYGTALALVISTIRARKRPQTQSITIDARHAASH
jgi:hypothetical protein